MTGRAGMAGYRCRLHLCCGPCPECGGCDRVCGCAPPSPRLALVPPAARAVRPCGTNAAYHRHLDRGERACPPCLAAHSAYTTARRPPAVRRAAAASRTGAIAADIARRAGSGEMASLPPRGDLTAAYGASRATIGKALRAARDAGAQLPPARPPVPATEDVAAHLRHLRLEGRSELTIYARGRTLARLQAALPVPLAGATRDMLYEWRAGLTVTGPTAAGYLSHVMEYYGWLAGTGRRADDPARGLPVPPVPRRLPRPIGEDDLMRALDLAPDRVRLWLILAAYAGLRCKEIALLRREEIRDTAVPPCLVVSTETTKGIRERIIPLSDWVVAEIRAAGLPATGYCFLREDGQEGPNSPWWISKLGNRALRDLGIRATMHQLRHRAGTKLYQHSRDLLMVRDVLGHADVSTTQIYAQYDVASATAAVNALPVPRLRLVKDRKE